jgi:hypothetical protein
MSDGMIGHSHVTIPDFTEPVVGFRTFRVVVRAKSPAWEEKIFKRASSNEPFVEPNEFVTDPYTGKMVKNYVAIAEAYKKWQQSLGEFKIVEHPAIEEDSIALYSPNKTGHIWQPGVNTAVCKKSAYSFRSGEYPVIHKDGPPAHECECGLYSYYVPRYNGQQNILWAIVTSWGKMEVHETGMRSEFMKVEALLVPHWDELPAHVISTWDPSVTLISAPSRNGAEYETKYRNEVNSKLLAVSREFGTPLPEDLRPKRDDMTEAQKQAYILAAQTLQLEKDRQRRREFEEYHRRQKYYEKYPYYDPAFRSEVQKAQSWREKFLGEWKDKP